MKKTTIAIIGTHGAGKTTLSRAVSRSLGGVFHQEIGEQFRNASLGRDPTAHAARPQPEFDKAVIRKELERDLQWQQSKEKLRIVETWHPGNLAYAKQRNPEIITPEIFSQIKKASVGAIVLPLRIEKAAAMFRLKEEQKQLNFSNEEMVDFFLQVGKSAEEISAHLGLTTLPPLNTDSIPEEESVNAAIFRINQILEK